MMASILQYSVPCKRIVYILQILVCISHRSRGSASYSVTILPGMEDCFFVRTPVGQAAIIGGTYDILNDEARGKIFSAYMHDLSSFNKNLWESPKDSQEGVFSVTLDSKVNQVELCFNVEKEVDDDEVEDDGLTIGFNIYVHPAIERTLPEGEFGPDAERAIGLVSEANELETQWRILLDHFDFLRVRESQHKAVSSQILSRVMSWTILEAFLVVAMAIGQVFYWRKFFEQKRYL